MLTVIPLYKHQEILFSMATVKIPDNSYDKLKKESKRKHKPMSKLLAEIIESKDNRAASNTPEVKSSSESMTNELMQALETYKAIEEMRKMFTPQNALQQILELQQAYDQLKDVFSSHKQSSDIGEKVLEWIAKIALDAFTKQNNQE